MSRTPARFTQADIARATRAAMQVGAGSVRLLPDGTIQINLQAEVTGEKKPKDLESQPEVVL